jgi:hypothetical protein
MSNEAPKMATDGPVEPAYWWEWVGKIPAMGEPDYDLIDARAAEFERVLLDVVATWEEAFDAGPGVVCSVKDAARVLAKYATRPAFDFGMLHSCSCGVMSGGIRTPSESCEVHLGR